MASPETHHEADRHTHTHTSLVLIKPDNIEGMCVFCLSEAAAFWTCWQVGTWSLAPRRLSHRGESLVQARLSSTCSSTWFRCFTTSRNRPCSDRTNTSITCTIPHTHTHTLFSNRELNTNTHTHTRSDRSDQVVLIPYRSDKQGAGRC